MWQIHSLEKMIEQAAGREVEEVLDFFQVDVDHGLSSDQVEQVGSQHHRMQYNAAHCRTLHCCAWCSNVQNLPDTRPMAV